MLEDVSTVLVTLLDWSDFTYYGKKRPLARLRLALNPLKDDLATLLLTEVKLRPETECMEDDKRPSASARGSIASSLSSSSIASYSLYLLDEVRRGPLGKIKKKLISIMTGRKEKANKLLRGLIWSVVVKMA
jgi:hypothetical protein